MRNIIYCIGLLLVAACAAERKSDKKAIAGAENTVDSTFTGACPYLFTSGDTAAVFSWIRTLSDSEAVLCFKVSNGNGFGKTITVPGSGKVKPHGENLSKVILSPDGRIIAAWGVANPNPENKYSGLIFYSSSADGGENWTTPAPLSPAENSIDQRYFDLEILPGGTVGAVWLDSRKNTKHEGSSLYFATFGQSNTFEGEKPIDETVCQCCRTDLFVDKTGGLHVAYRKILNDSIRDMVHIVSLDNGKSFSTPERISPDNWVISACPHTGPAIVQTDSALSFVWYTMGAGKGVFFASSEDNGKTFSAKNAVGNSTAGKHPQIQLLKNGNQAIVWDEHTENGSLIGLEVRSPNGEKLKTAHLTSKLGYATFPVVKLVNNELLIAYAGSGTAEDKERVYFQKVNVDDFMKK
ncbi:glycoside hydrolase [Dyadobacter sp. CY261]|uniref:sialidase family protein n=1 Tax=Dyadobacter sp. CY261 TaxID=2907203 RepID=UPI001F35411E|nr:sialidase family protein [Dyadobacter sp. CY261]MCF0072887.1 glycoside hydrolase [Dyadobacter sp. CY261]